jgi:hypothetical protein
MDHVYAVDLATGHRRWPYDAAATILGTDERCLAAE